MHVTRAPDGTDFIAEIDATAGGGADAEKNPYVYLDLIAGQKVDLTDVQAQTASTWDIAFKRWQIKINSGDSGPGGVKTATVPATELSQVTTAPSSGYVPDHYFGDACNFLLDANGGPSTALSTWYDYDRNTHQLTPAKQEKQKLRYHYGLTERQLRRVVEQATRGKGASGLLERRIDNLVFRAGFAPTIPAARQLVRHGHILLNGHKADIPSMRVARGDIISVREKSRTIAVFADSQLDARLLPPWMAVDKTAFTARLTDTPDEGSIPFPLAMRLVIEFYAQ